MGAIHPAAQGSDAWFERAFDVDRFMLIARGLGASATLALAETAWGLGLHTVEVPIQSDRDIESLRVVAAAAADRGMQVGAGTVIAPAQVLVAAAAGAAFTVSPGVDEEVIHASLDAGLPTLPGVATASDVQRVQRVGLHWLKVFPASELGPNWIRAMRGPFPTVRFVATGGMTPQNAPAYLEAGASVIALGSALHDPKTIGLLSNLSPHG